MAGHLVGKGAKIAQFWGQNVNQKFTFLPIKGGAEISAQIKAKTQLNSAKIPAQETVPKPSNSKPKSHQKPSKNCEKKPSFVSPGLLFFQGLILLNFSPKIQPKTVGYWVSESKKNFGFQPIIIGL